MRNLVWLLFGARKFCVGLAVVTLRKYLKKLGLPVVGKKADLMERLAAAVATRQDSDEEDLVDVSVEESDQNLEAVEDVSQIVSADSVC